MIAGHGQANLFSPPWTVEEMVACFVANDNAGRALAYVYFCGKAAHQGRDSAHRNQYGQAAGASGTMGDVLSFCRRAGPLQLTQLE
jgi:hypothetical protein